MKNVSALKEELNKVIRNTPCAKTVQKKFAQRITEDKLIRDENPKDHFSTFFMAIDPKLKELFVGMHKKAQLWLPNGGHIEKGETTYQTLVREIQEEWGLNLEPAVKPSVLTITNIENDRQICRIHYDIWYFIYTNKDSFAPKESAIKEEFEEVMWLPTNKIGQLKTSIQMMEVTDMLNQANSIFRK